MFVFLWEGGQREKKRDHSRFPDSKLGMELGRWILTAIKEVWMLLQPTYFSRRNTFWGIRGYTEDSFCWRTQKLKGPYFLDKKLSC